jgi:dinuclear metal center YbgI/SA1388 family protein
MTTVGDILAAVDRLAPFRLAADWDNVGLLVGERERRVRRLLVTLDVTESVCDEADAFRAECILAHHPLIRKGISRLTSDTRPGRLALRCLAQRRAVIAAHTNLDFAAGGLCDILAESLGLEITGPLIASPPDAAYKVVVFVPETDLEAVRAAAFAAGAGRIGAYAECGFSVEGTGTFLPGAGARPTLGKVGRPSAVREHRLEVLCEERSLGRVTAAIARAHSYEEPAIDIYPLRPAPAEAGAGRVARFARPRRLADVCAAVKKALRLRTIPFAGDPGRKIERVAICTGGGNSLGEAVAAAGCQAYLTGELKYHETQDLAAAGIAVILGGHHRTERIPLETWAKRFAKEVDVDLRLSRSEADAIRLV